jgi:membrane protein DedA with SNARE-associated domain
MNDLLALVTHHGYVIIFLIVLAEALGIPVPAALALVTGGAAVASGALRARAAALTAVTAMLVGDSLLYVLGNRMGWRLLGFLCRVSIDPETCILRFDRAKRLALREQGFSTFVIVGGLVAWRRESARAGAPDRPGASSDLQPIVITTVTAVGADSYTRTRPFR